MMFDTDICPICNKHMIKQWPKNYDNPYFPNYIEMTQQAQAERAGVVFRSNVTVDEHYICVECAEAGKADFLCVLCNERKSTDKIQERYGDPPDFLCKDCYKTVSAEVWETKCDELREEHRYDFD